MEPAGDFFVDDDDFFDAESAVGSPMEFQDAEDPESNINVAMRGRTTVMIQRITPRQTEMDVHRALMDVGLGGTYDLIYVPLNRKRTSNLGYAFVNFCTEESASA